LNNPLVVLNEREYSATRGEMDALFPFIFVELNIHFKMIVTEEKKAY